jgi:hypothetical protein
VDVPSEQSFPIEDFIDAITSQLDRVQDALRLKAVNRPLTYALKDLELELKVYVDLDEQGKVRFRTSGPNESGASTVHLSFTTITKPMIEENTVSLAVSRSPTLQEAGLAPDEQRRLERLGVRTIGQLARLGDSTSVNAVSRLSDVSPARLRSALELGRPRVTTVQPERPPVQPAPPASVPPRGGVRQPPVAAPPQASAPAPPVKTAPTTPPAVRAPATPPRVIRVAPDLRRLRVAGENLVNEQGVASVTLNDVPLGSVHADDDALVLELPAIHTGGTLDIRLPDGEVSTWTLSVEGEPLAYETNGADAWAPGEQR